MLEATSKFHKYLNYESMLVTKTENVKDKDSHVPVFMGLLSVTALAFFFNGFKIENPANSLCAHYERTFTLTGGES